MLGMIYGAWAGIALGLAVRNCCVDCCMYLLLVASCILLHGIIALSLLPQSPVQLGSFLFRATVKQRSFARLDISADFDENIPEPSTGGHVSKKLAKILGFTDEWVRMPDYQRVRLQQSADGTVGYHPSLCPGLSVCLGDESFLPPAQLVWFNQVIKTLWPHIGKVVYKQALEQAKPALADVCKSVRFLMLHGVCARCITRGDCI